MAPPVCALKLLALVLAAGSMTVTAAGCVARSLPPAPRRPRTRRTQPAPAPLVGSARVRMVPATTGSCVHSWLAATHPFPASRTQAPGRRPARRASCSSTIFGGATRLACGRPSARPADADPRACGAGLRRRPVPGGASCSRRRRRCTTTTPCRRPTASAPPTAARPATPRTRRRRWEARTRTTRATACPARCGGGRCRSPRNELSSRP